jgi:alpha-tubulin suppressor-like RCC1 family protein
MGLTAVSVDIDYDNGCAVDTTQQLWCWGDDLQGALGNGMGEADSEIPQRVVGAMLARDVSVGSGFTCIITTTGAVQCWGVNNVSQLGDDAMSPRELPGPTVAGLPGSVDQLAAGNDHVCARIGTAIYCWGSNFGGAVGLPHPAVPESAVPVQICVP